LVIFSSVLGAVILAAAFVACFLSSAAWVTSQTAAIAAERNVREAKQVEVQLMYTNALMIREGLVRPGDMVFGPEGNLEYDGHKFIKPKEKP
jgi:type IV secretory pathway TraG/TraD family ATPase VirD4